MYMAIKRVPEAVGEWPFHTRRQGLSRRMIRWRIFTKCR